MVLCWFCDGLFVARQIGSLEWMAPEVLGGSRDYDLKADIYR